MSMTDEKNPDVELTAFGAVLPSPPTSRDVIKELTEIPSKQNGPEARTVSSENETMRRATDGLAAPGTGSPLPTTLRPSKHKTAVTPRERDGLGRE